MRFAWETPLEQAFSEIGETCFPSDPVASLPDEKNEADD
jgi:hypothetical protein